MGENENLDISKVVGLIMENPKLIEEISRLAKAEQNKEPTEETGESAVEEIPHAENVATVAEPIYKNDARGARAQLLTAFKPYVSPERARAIDSMISIADILDMMRTR